MTEAGIAKLERKRDNEGQETDGRTAKRRKRYSIRVNCVYAHTRTHTHTHLGLFLGFVIFERLSKFSTQCRAYFSLKCCVNVAQ